MTEQQIADMITSRVNDLNEALRMAAGRSIKVEISESQINYVCGPRTVISAKTYKRLA